MHTIHIKRIYAPISPDDGCRFLVDGLWPRGMSKEKAQLTEWLKAIAPSKELRKDFHSGNLSYDDFAVQYTAELDQSEAAAAFADRCRDILQAQAVTLVYGRKDETHNNAVVLCDWLKAQLAR